jgi:cytoskeletal protein CcmA (bactofilin family)
LADSVIKGGTTARLARVEGDLRVGPKARIMAETGRMVVVQGGAYLSGPATIECDLECESMMLRGKGFGPGGDVAILGNLTVHGVASIDASVDASGRIAAGDLDVGGHLRSGSVVSRRVRVGGHMQTAGRLEATDVDVGGHMTVQEDVALTNLRVGGHARIGGGIVKGEIRVRGHFSTRSKLTFGHAQVFGHAVFPAGSAGDKLSAVGGVEFDGDATCKDLEVSGSAKAHGSFHAGSVEVKGGLDVARALSVSKELRIYGTGRVGGLLDCGGVRVLGKLTAERVTVAGEADVVGEVSAPRGFEAKSIIVSRGSKVLGPLVGVEVEVGKEMDPGSVWGLPWWRSAVGRKTKVDDVHGKRVRLWPNSRAGRIFADIVEMDEGSTAAELTYTGEVRLHDNNQLTKPPIKSEKLIDPPT